MITTYDIAILLYNIMIVPVVFFSLIALFLSLTNVLMSKKKTKYPKLKELPFISVQVPTFNDPIAARCVEHCMKLNYPKNKFEIVIVDDSTNKDTQKLLKQYADDNPGFIKYIHRTNREGFKPGALRNAMKITKGELLVVFDSDWIPQKDFLRKVVKPFGDPKVAIVQTRQGFYNKNTNLITRFASYLLMTYHTVVLPINNKINAVFFGGTAGAIRRTVFDEVGGWNSASITEDSELSVRMLMKGYKTAYLEMETPSEVPDTLESFIKQQMRWCYGNTRVFLDNSSDILGSRQLSIKQKLMIMYITLGNFIAPAVVLMAFFGFSGWFLGNPELFNLSDLVTFTSRFIITAGFLIFGFITLRRHKILGESFHLVFSALTLGLVLAIANSYAFFKAVFNSKLHWYCTPKVDNSKAFKK